jgi:hypothetical protein
MKILLLIVAAIWFDGVGIGIGVGLAIASHIEGRGSWQYVPQLAFMLMVLVAFVVAFRRAARSVISGRVAPTESA